MTGTVRRTTKLIEGGHRGLQAYRSMLLLLRFVTFFTCFKIQKVVTFSFFAVSHTLSRTMSGNVYAVAELTEFGLLAVVRLLSPSTH